MSRYPTGTTNEVIRLLDQVDAKYVNQIELIAEVGSTAHGISAGNDDLDFIVVWTENLRQLLPLNPKGTRMIRTQPEGTRSGPGDIDLQVYSMRKYVSLAVAGNPSMMVPLFVPQEMRMLDNGFPSEELARMAHTKSAGRKFQGYLHAQLSRWQDGRIKSRVSRPELIEAHGYDTKYAAHAIRLGLQGIEFLDTGRIALPMEEPAAGWLREIRAGEVEERFALNWCDKVMRALSDRVDNSTLPEFTEPDEVQQFLFKWQRDRL